MIEGYINVAQAELDEELETAAVAGAAAVQRLIADRNNLRSQLAASRAAQEELRQRLARLHQRYIELAKRVVAQLHHFDSTMRDALRDKPEPSGESNNHACIHGSNSTAADCRWVHNRPMGHAWQWFASAAALGAK
jgi:hypothetical protein